MAEKETARLDIGLMVEEADKYRDWQHKLFIEKETGHTYQLIGFGFAYIQPELCVILSYTRMPRFKRIVDLACFGVSWEPVEA